MFIEKSKTDVYRDGNWVLIANGESKLCPASLLRLYLRKANLEDLQSPEFLFRAISKGKFVEKLRKTPKHISYSRVRELLLAALKKIGLNVKDYGTHSLRSGGATAAANADVPDRLFKRHGRWQSDKAKDGYVKDNVTRLLSVSRALGL